MAMADRLATGLNWLSSLTLPSLRSCTMFRSLILLIATASFVTVASAQPLANRKHSDSTDRFFQIDDWLPTPNEQRTASGEPGPGYWQQRADYEIDVTLDDANQRIQGNVKIDYHNQSPHALRYVWIQLDQNRFRKDSDDIATTPAYKLEPKISFQMMNAIMARLVFDGGYKIESVTDGDSNPIDHTIVKTMMRVDLPTPLPPGKSTTIAIKYSYQHRQRQNDPGPRRIRILRG